MSKSETESLKAFLTETKDSLRVLYRDEAKDNPRRFIFIGTTNEDAPLKSQTGNRRWLPVWIERPIDVDKLDRETVEQLYAEAVVDYAAGDEFLVPKHMKETAKAIQNEARSTSAIEDALSGFALPNDCFITPAAMEAWARACRYHQIGAIRSAFKLAGFKRTTHRIAGKVERVWLKGEAAKAMSLRVQEFANGSAELLQGEAPKPWVPALPAS